VSRSVLKASITSSSPSETVIQRTRIKSNDFDPSTFYQLDRAYCISPTKFSLSSFLKMNESENKNTSLETLRHELLVRLGHLQMFLFNLDDPLQKQRTFRELLLLQGQSFKDVNNLVTRKTPELAVLSDCLERVGERLCLATLRLEEAVRGAGLENIQELYDKFQGWQISIEMVLALQLALINDSSPQQNLLPGGQLDVLSLARQAYKDAVEVLGHPTFPPLQLKGIEVTCKAKTRRTEAVHLTYPEQHLWRILHSLFLNSIRANMKSGKESGRQEFDPVTVLVVKGLDEVSLKISDLGGGIGRDRDVFSYQMPQSSLKLPAVRKLSRYLGGELSLASMTGLGTDAVLNLNSRAEQTIENFP